MQHSPLIRMRAARRWLAWAVALTVLFGALLPAVASAAARSAGGEVWLEICTAYGVERVALDAGASDDQPAPREPACEWCRLHAADTAILCELSGAHVPAASGATLRARSPAAPVWNSFDWQVASPRAPPAHA